MLATTTPRCHVDGKGVGVQRFVLDENSGEMAIITAQDVGVNPTCLCYDDSALFVVNETQDGTVKSFKVDDGTGALTQVSSLSTKGADPCYCEVFDASTTLGCKLLLVQATRLALRCFSTPGRWGFGRVCILSAHNGNAGSQQEPARGATCTCLSHSGWNRTCK